MKRKKFNFPKIRSVNINKVLDKFFKSKGEAKMPRDWMFRGAIKK